ncbi:uncharacterized protein LOC110016040 isoform X2 [Oryzias latipes]
MRDVDHFVKLYFRIGFTNKEILNLLATQNQIIISIRTLKRICRKLGLFRRKHHTDLEEILTFVEEEMIGSGQLQGYRWLHQRALQRGFVVSQETIRALIKILDPEGVDLRRARRLRRRQYTCRGPNALWHVDSYDKLKPYGIAINGCIDGFSRHVMWMEAYTTNSDPKVIADYYINTVTRVGGCPQRLRADPGTENAHIREMQMFLRRHHADHHAGQQSFIYGSSTANQRIESWRPLGQEPGAVLLPQFNSGRIKGGCENVEFAPANDQAFTEFTQRAPHPSLLHATTLWRRRQASAGEHR